MSSLGTAVYRTVRTVVWEDGLPTKDRPPTRLHKPLTSVQRGRFYSYLYNVCNKEICARYTIFEFLSNLRD